MKKLVLSYPDCRQEQQISYQVDGSIIMIIAGVTIKMCLNNMMEKYEGRLCQNGIHVALVWFDTVHVQQ